MLGKHCIHRSHEIQNIHIENPINACITEYKQMYSSFPVKRTHASPELDTGSHLG